MSAVTAMPEDVHQRTSENEEEGKQLQKMRVMAIEHPRHRRGEADPQQPLVDVRPVHPSSCAIASIGRNIHGDAPS
jgi:hypothetical protein